MTIIEGTVQLHLALAYQAGNRSHPTLPEQPLVRHMVRPAVPKDPPQRPSTEDIESSPQTPSHEASLFRSRLLVLLDYFSRVVLIRTDYGN